MRHVLVILLITLCAFGNFLFNGVKLFEHTCSTDDLKEISFHVKKCDHSSEEKKKTKSSTSCCSIKVKPKVVESCCSTPHPAESSFTGGSKQSLQKLCCKIKLHNFHPGINFSNVQDSYSKKLSPANSPSPLLSHQINHVYESFDDFTYKDRRLKKTNTKKYILLERYLL